MGTVLNPDQRRHLDATVQRARIAAEQAAADALYSLAAAEPSRPAYLSDDDNSLRLALREKARQLGDTTVRSGADLTHLTREVAYEQWHRLLFARFLEVNGLLRHPEFRDTPLTLEDCADLADDLGEPDGWSVAARFAAEILPGVFRLDDPAVRVRFATEHRLELENILLSLPSALFEAEDALGWVYQFWQTAEKKRVNESGVKIGGADLAPVTQLFTENYMVRFLLENSLGAWWAARHPDSSLIAQWEYLRRLDDGTPAAGTFNEWPATSAAITVMDPCCGSGHFLVAMFGMLWQMRAEEEGLSPTEAQYAVLRDNLHGLELDPRCTQIATFNVALGAWKQGGFRDLPPPHIACSGVPVRGAKEEWLAFAAGDGELSKVLGRLHALFRNADTLGSLITPRPEVLDGALFGSDMSIGVSWEQVRLSLGQLLERERQDATVLGYAASDVVEAAGLLARRYTLVATNPPFLSRGKQTPVLRAACEQVAADTVGDLAVTMPAAWMTRATTLALVTPQNWQEKSTYEAFRHRLLTTCSYRLYARCGNNVWQIQAGKQPFKIPTVLSVIEHCRPVDAKLACIDIGNGPVVGKPHLLRSAKITSVPQSDQLDNPEARILGIVIPPGVPLVGDIADCLQGTSTGDTPRYVLQHWELPQIDGPWRRWVSSSETRAPFDNRTCVVRWEGDRGVKAADGSAIRGEEAWGRSGVSITQMGNLSPSLYNGELFDTNAAAVVPQDPGDTAALWCFATSDEFVSTVRAIASSTQVTNGALALVPFDVEVWRQRATREYPTGLPMPTSSDPCQWLFNGDLTGTNEVLQVAVARLLGYRWPEQDHNELDHFADADGIAALQSLPNEPGLGTRLREFLAATYGSGYSSALERTLVLDTGGKSGRLEDWLRDSFFAQHIKVFGSRPFLWHVWDGRDDGFSAVVNYHRLDHKALEKLIFTSLGAWMERQKHEAAAGRAGADARLGAAEALQAKLKLILDGVPPYDIYVRWKALHEQPIGWNPDLDDGVRVNIRPFMMAGVLRSKVNVDWKKDRGTDADGSERINDLHPTLEERWEARREVGAKA